MPAKPGSYHQIRPAHTKCSSLDSKQNVCGELFYFSLIAFESNAPTSLELSFELTLTFGPACWDLNCDTRISEPSVRALHTKRHCIGEAVAFDSDSSGGCSIRYQTGPFRCSQNARLKVGTQLGEPV